MSGRKKKIKDNNFPDCKNLNNIECLEEIYKWAINNVDNYIDWYDKYKRTPRFLSRSIRAGSLLLGSIGITAPLIDNIKVSENQLFSFINCPEWGYLLIALAGMSMLFDKYFGFSSSWSRYIYTEINLERKRNQFMVEWSTILEKSETSDIYQHKINILKKFVQDIEDIVVKETESWIQEFKDNINNMEILLKDNKRL